MKTKLFAAIVTIGLFVGVAVWAASPPADSCIKAVRDVNHCGAKP